MQATEKQVHYQQCDRRLTCCHPRYEATEKIFIHLGSACREFICFTSGGTLLLQIYINMNVALQEGISLLTKQDIF